MPILQKSCTVGPSVSLEKIDVLFRSFCYTIPRRVIIFAPAKK
jgi:hypothetical protein